MKAVIKLFLGFFVFCMTAGLIGGSCLFWWASQEFIKPSVRAQPVEILIGAGDNIPERLLSAGVLFDTKSAILFRLGGKITGQATKLKAGEYEIPAHASIKDILDLLESGKVIQRQITIREGLTNWEIRQFLLAHEGLVKVEDVPLKAEGMYLPETYSYQKGDSAVDIMERMNVALEKTLGDAWISRAPDLPLKTKEEALALASIIEKETSVPEERRRVAGVFINRLKRSIPLQTDPTVIYALTLGEHKNEGQGPLGRRLLKKDLEIDSPYNTYKYAGLPPTPIANAGKASIEAALNPEDHDYIYFVADGKGGHAFAKTLDEHNANVAKWRKIRAEQE